MGEVSAKRIIAKIVATGFTGHDGIEGWPLKRLAKSFLNPENGHFVSKLPVREG